MGSSDELDELSLGRSWTLGDEEVSFSGDLVGGVLPLGRIF